MPEALIVLRGAPAEATMLERIGSATRVARVAAAPCALPRLFALCELAQSMISIDTGPAHAAAALGAPLVVLYGIQSSRVWLPRSCADSPVLALEAERVERISPQAVLDAWRSLPRARSSGAPR